MTVHGWRGKASPDRLDALVWAITDLMLDRGAGLVARVRGLDPISHDPATGAGRADPFQFRSRMHGLAVFPRAEARGARGQASAAAGGVSGRRAGGLGA